MRERSCAHTWFKLCVLSCWKKALVPCAEWREAELPELTPMLFTLPSASCCTAPCAAVASHKADSADVNNIMMPRNLT